MHTLAGAANRIAGIILAMGSAWAPFVAIFRTLVVPPPVQASETWKDKFWNRLFGPPGPQSNPVSPLESDAHNMMIGMAAAGILLAAPIHLLGQRHLRGGGGRGVGLPAAWAGALAGLTGSGHGCMGFDGRWQRRGFACVIACELLLISRVCGHCEGGQGSRLR